MSELETSPRARDASLYGWYATHLLEPARDAPLQCPEVIEAGRSEPLSPLCGGKHAAGGIGPWSIVQAVAAVLPEVGGLLPVGGLLLRALTPRPPDAQVNILFPLAPSALSNGLSHYYCTVLLVKHIHTHGPLPNQTCHPVPDAPVALAPPPGCKI